ncbi:MAG: glycosyltransferase, partial [Bacteroidales bacterium]|nr:glycosyltransferase [Bacteroidales bacterium]
LCFNTAAIPPCEEFKNIENRPLKVLYCGTVTQRKGIKYLLEAFRKIPKSTAELHIIGGIQGSGKAFDTYKDVYTYHGAIPQNVLFTRYQEFDILVLPTIFEGFGLVIPEAMAAGLPVITTQNSFGYEIIKHHQNGSIIPIRDTDALIKEILYYASLNNDSFNQMRIAAKNSAEGYTREQFRQRIKNIINDICLI